LLITVPGTVKLASYPIEEEAAMHDTPNVDNADKDYQDAVNNMVETIIDTSVMRTQTQLDDLRDKFKEALDNADS
jgi:hypothetical protein